MQQWNVSYSIKECNELILNNTHFHRGVIDSVYGIIINDCAAVVPSLSCEYIKKESCFKYSFSVNAIEASCIIIPAFSEVVLHIKSTENAFDRDDMALFLKYCFCTNNCSYETFK